MARQSKVLPARKPRDRSRDDDSLLLRSAESLGRVIGALQRQLDSATKRLSDSTGNGNGHALTAKPRAPRKSTAGTRKRATAAKRPPPRKASTASKKR